MTKKIDRAALLEVARSQANGLDIYADGVVSRLGLPLMGEPDAIDLADAQTIAEAALTEAAAIAKTLRKLRGVRHRARLEVVRKNPRKGRASAYKAADAEVIAATAARKIAEREALEAEPAIAEAARRFMAGDTSAGEEVARASGALVDARRKLGAALERERLAIHRRQRAMTIGNPRPEYPRACRSCGETFEEWEIHPESPAVYPYPVHCPKCYAAEEEKEAERLRRYQKKTAAPRAKKNPAPIPKLALLGEAIEVETSANGKRQIIRPAGAVLLVSADAKTIVIARPKSTTPTNAPAGSAGARRMFEKWSQFKSDRAVRLVIGDKPLTHKLGNVEAIRYRSDKWTGRPTLYEHKFEKPATAIADSPRAPSVIRIDGEPRRVLVNERGIVG